MEPRGQRIAAVVAGAAAAGLSDVVTSRTLPDRLRMPAVSGGLVVAALVYPAARDRPHRGMAAAVEWLAVGATVAAGISAARRPRPGQATILAAAWASHAAFDVTHRRGPDSRIPHWYPALCAGYDVALAALLMARAT